jgi:hypothetical protein
MRLVGVFICSGLVGVAGCGESGERIPVYPVSGQVVYDGKPAAGVQVYFVPTSAPMVPRIPSNPHAVTGPDGRFKITTYDENDGAPEGGYQVLLIWPEVVTESEESTKDKLFGWFDGAHTKLKIDVKTGSNEMPPIAIKAITGPPEELKGIPGKN